LKGKQSNVIWIRVYRVLEYVHVPCQYRINANVLGARKQLLYKQIMECKTTAKINGNIEYGNLGIRCENCGA